MAGPGAQRWSRRHVALLKVCYLLAVTAVVFALPATPAPALAQWLVIGGFLVAQAVVLLACRVKAFEIVRPVWKLKWLFVLLLAFYALLPPEKPCCDVLVAWRVSGLGWTVSINLTGLQQAGLMCLQIVTVLLTSTVVRSTGSGRDLVEGLKAFRLPDLFVHSLDQTLATFVGGRRPGHRREQAPEGRGFFSLVREMTRGDFSGFVKTIEGNMALAAGRTDGDRKLNASLAHDVPVVTGIALCMASLKMLKVLPGLPFASGHKTFLLFPLYVLAARLTHSRWGSTAAGSIMGVIGFLQGDGRFGVLEVFKHTAPGIVIDLGEPLARRLPPWALGYCLLGFVAAIARTATELLLVLLLGARAEIYLFPLARLVPNLLAGTLSGFVTVFVVRAFESSGGPRPDQSAHGQSASEPASPEEADISLGPGRADAPDHEPAADATAAKPEQIWAPGSRMGGGRGRRRGVKGTRDGP